MLELLKNNVQLVHGVKMINFEEHPWVFTDASGDFEEVLEVSKEMVENLPNINCLDIIKFKQENPDTYFIGSWETKELFGSYISVPVEGEYENTFLYWDFH